MKGLLFLVILVALIVTAYVDDMNSTANKPVEDNVESSMSSSRHVSEHPL